MAELTDDQSRHLRAAIALSHTAKSHGNGPYGAVLVGPDGTVLAEAENTQVTERDPTGHAEANLIRDAAARYDAPELESATLYASAEPCAMCAAAIFWSGIGRVVYALSGERNQALLPVGDALGISCREVLARGSRPVEVVGPAFEEEAAKVFDA